MSERPSPTVILAARHLDLTEGRMGLPGHIVDDSDRSALSAVLNYVAAQYNAPKEPPVAPAQPAREQRPKNLHDAARWLATLLRSLDDAGYEVGIGQEQERLRVHLKGDEAAQRWVEVGSPHGYWDVTMASSADAEAASSDVTVPYEALAKLIHVARLAVDPLPNVAAVFADPPRHEAARRALAVLDAAGLLSGGSAATAGEAVPNNLESK